MAEIKCPMCGKPNPAELDVCQYCEARLKPLTDALSRSQPPIHPGEEPVEKNTSELEPVLPQWLRDVRQQARDSVEDEPEQTPAEEESPPEESADLLAGLQSQAKDDEEIPDWLVDLRGEGAQTVSEEASTEEDDLSSLRNMLGEETSGEEEDEASTLPGWMSDLGAGEAEAESGELSDFLADKTAEEPAASGMGFEWNADFESDSGPSADSAEDESPIDSGLPTWLQGADEEAKDESEGGLPDWMKTEESAQAVSPVESEEPVEAAPQEGVPGGDMPDWLSSLGEESAEAPPQEDVQPVAESDMPDWFSSLGEEGAETPQQGEVQPAVEGESPDWLASLGEESLEAAPLQEDVQPAAESDMPDWFSSLGEEGTKAPPQEEAQPAVEGESPDWLSSLGEESAEATSEQEDLQPAVESDMPDWLSSLGKEGTEAPPQEEAQPAIESESPDWLASLGEEGVEAAPEQEAVQPAAEGDMPDWLSSMGEAAAGFEESPDEAASSVSMAEEAPLDAGIPPAFVDDEDEPLSTGDVEALFAADMPDWLTGGGQPSEEESPIASAETEASDLRPAELPSWVQAMRPVEAVISETGEGKTTDQYMEETGPLAGLRGVLPAVPGVGPSSVPKAYSIKLRASEDQQSGASMLEQMLATEINPKPITTQPIMLSQRFLRWIIAIVLLVVVGGSLFTGTQMNFVPLNVSPEVKAFLEDFVQGSLPTEAPVLLIFDYNAALAGELEAAAAPLVDYMVLQKAPRLSLISSTPTGPGLAEHFMNLENTQASIYYRAGEQFINLGYLPGGAAGVLAFAVEPAMAKTTSITGENAWETPVLQGVSHLSDFAAIILLTDDVETARIWIEQTETVRKDTRFLVISSAQSGPMILPYLQSGQVDAVLTGLDGGAPIEQFNGGRPGTARRYWDAYGFGLLVALVMIAFGSLWSLVSGWRERRREQGEV